MLGIRLPSVEHDYHEFSPPLLRIEETPPRPLGRTILRTLLALLCFLLIWALTGRLEIVAVAEGKLVPQSYVKIVQPADAGIVREILAAEGERVRAGQVLMRMDAQLTDADARSVDAEYHRQRLRLRRIDAELAGQPFSVRSDDPPLHAAEAAAQYRANLAAHTAALAEADSGLEKARAELASAQQIKEKLDEVLPHYREQDEAFDRLRRDGFAGPLMAGEKKRDRIEKEQELKTQLHLIESARATIQQLERNREQIRTDYRRQLHTERVEAKSSFDRLTEERSKLAIKQAQLELTASQDAIVKDLATHTIGTVVQPGTVLLTLVPVDDRLLAEVWVGNDDIGFVRTGQPVRVKLAAFRFQKYGMVEGVVAHVSPDASGGPIDEGSTNGATRATTAGGLGYKALVALKTMELEVDGARFPLAAGMQSSAEIVLGTRTVAEYLLSPVSKAWHEAGRER